MRFAVLLWAAIAAGGFLCGAPEELEISLGHGTTAEVETRDQLQRLLKKYDLSDWLWTRKIAIEDGSIPHSHPVLTLHTRHLKDDLLLLSTFVHEEYQRFETAHSDDTYAAIAEFKTKFPGLPAGGLEGAQDEESSLSSYHRLLRRVAENESLGRAGAGPPNHGILGGRSLSCDLPAGARQ